MFQASEVYIFDLMLSIFQSYIVDNLTVVHYRRKVDVLGYSFAFSSSVSVDLRVNRISAIYRYLHLMEIPLDGDNTAES